MPAVTPVASRVAAEMAETPSVVAERMEASVEMTPPGVLEMTVVVMVIVGMVMVDESAEIVIRMAAAEEER